MLNMRQMQIKNIEPGPGTSLEHHPIQNKKLPVDSWSGHILNCGFHLPSGHKAEATYQCFSHINVFLSLPFSVKTKNSYSRVRIKK